MRQRHWSRTPLAFSKTSSHIYFEFFLIFCDLLRRLFVKLSMSAGETNLRGIIALSEPTRLLMGKVTAYIIILVKLLYYFVSRNAVVSMIACPLYTLQFCCFTRA